MLFGPKLKERLHRGDVFLNEVGKDACFGVSEVDAKDIGEVDNILDFGALEQHQVLSHAIVPVATIAHRRRGMRGLLWVDLAINGMAGCTSQKSTKAGRRRLAVERMPPNSRMLCPAHGQLVRVACQQAECQRGAATVVHSTATAFVAVGSDARWQPNNLSGELRYRGLSSR